MVLVTAISVGSFAELSRGARTTWIPREFVLMRVTACSQSCVTTAKFGESEDTGKVKDGKEAHWENLSVWCSYVLQLSCRRFISSAPSIPPNMSMLELTQPQKLEGQNTTRCAP